MSEVNPPDEQSEERELDEAELEEIRGGGGRMDLSDTPASSPPSNAYVYPPPPSPMAGDSFELETT